MRALQLTLAVYITLASSISLAAEKRKLSSGELATRIVNSVETTDRLLLFMKVGASVEDTKFIEDLRKKAKNSPSPKIKISDEKMTVQGLPHPITIVDGRRSVVSYNGKIVKFDWSKGYKDNYELLEKALVPRSVALFDWILPQAHADFGMLGILGAAVAGFGAKAWMDGDDWGPIATLGGAGLFLIDLMKEDEKPKPMPLFQAQCMDGSVGRMTQLTAPDGSAMRTVGGYYPYQVMPGYPAVYGTQFQRAGGTMTGLCNSGANLFSANQAFQPTLPAYYSMPGQYPQYPQAANPGLAAASATNVPAQTVQSVRAPASGMQPQAVQSTAWPDAQR